MNAEEIRSAMARRAVSVREMARRTHYDPAYISRALRGQQRASDNLLRALADALQLTDDDERVAAPPPALVREPAETSSSPHLSADRAAIESFRTADRLLGGRRLYGAVTHYLHSSLAPRILGREKSDFSATYTAAAAMTEMAGWMAHDSGHDSLAQQHFSAALRLSRAGDDPALHSHVLASMSHLTLQTNRPLDALQLAQSGLRELKSHAFNPGLAAQLQAMKARALACVGEESAALRAIEDSRESLARKPEREPSKWVSPFDLASFSSEKVLCLVSLGKLAAAAEEAAHSVALRTGVRARSRAFSQITLAIIRTRLGDVDAACLIGRELLGPSHAVGSARITQQLGGLAAVMAPFRDNPHVAEMIDSIAEAMQQRKAPPKKADTQGDAGDS